jgi:hypothetical protein
MKSKALDTKVMLTTHKLCGKGRGETYFLQHPKVFITDRTAYAQDGTRKNPIVKK